MSLLVIGGSQGARVLSDVVPPAVALLPEALLRYLRVSQQARPEDLERSAAYAADGDRAEVQPFFDDMPAPPDRGAAGHRRAGASSVADICVDGPSRDPTSPMPPPCAITRPPMPRACRGRGRRSLIPERKLTPEVLSADGSAPS
jgi:UDP-N-acetylglucosamine--N-acetylmuramyl-(pentapeptide) pyrophosphoryl-undecaprenol N-acetylglucosamine transferase